MQLLSATLKSRIILPTPTLHRLYLIKIVSAHSSYAQFLCTRNRSHFDPPQLSILRQVPIKYKVLLGRVLGKLGGGVFSLL